MFKKLRGSIAANKVASGGVTALVVGGIAQVFGIDIAPADVDVIVTSVATLAALGPVIRRVYRAIRARFAEPKVGE